MTGDALHTLFHPFQLGTLAMPRPGEPTLLLGPPAALRLPDGFGGDITVVQGFRPDFLALTRGPWHTVAEPQGDGYDLVLVLAGRHRGQNERWLAQAVRRARQGGLIVAAGGKADGVASLCKRVEAALPLAGRLAKNHGLVFWFDRTAAADDLAGRFTDGADAAPLTDGRFETAPGMFSHEHVDPGSRLLADCLPAGLKGSAADFCAGWGYLAARLAEQAPGVGRIDLFEADHASLAAARRNMARLAPGATARFFWQDLVSEPVTERYDTIVMNPPFHTGRAAEPGLGQALIGVAAAALKPGGVLLLVANRQLPYEATLGANFARVEKLRDEAGFKVFRARR